MPTVKDIAKKSFLAGVTLNMQENVALGDKDTNDILFEAWWEANKVAITSSTKDGMEGDEKYKLTVGPYIVLNWYDGPLMEIAPVFEEGKPILIQVKSYLVMEVEDIWPWQKATLRLDRKELQAALDLLDGKVVKDYFSKE